MANFKQVNFGNDTIWLDIDKILYFYQPGEKDDPGQTVVKLVTGEVITLGENYADLLEEWGIIRKA